jgi:MFS family permease
MGDEPRRFKFRLLPPVKPEAKRVLLARALRAFGDGYVALLLPLYLGALGFSPLAIGIIATATLLGSAALTLAGGLLANRLGRQRILLLASISMIATGMAFGSVESFWPLLAIAIVGTLSPTGGDATLFVPIEHTVLAGSVADQDRTAVFVRYALVGSLLSAFGTLAAAVFDPLSQWLGPVGAGQAMFLAYGALGLGNLAIYRSLRLDDGMAAAAHAPLGPSKRIVYKLTALFSLDAFGGGFIVNTLIAVWLFQRFELSATTAGAIFFWAGVASSASYLAAAPLSRRIGLINTMVWTHVPANVMLAAAAFVPELWMAIALLVGRSLLSQMDVPTRTSYIMAVVTPEERPAAASLTQVPRGMASALSPAIAGWLLTLTTFGWPLVLGGGLKIVYDLMLLQQFRRVKPPEET